MSSYWDWEREVYPVLWREAFETGQRAWHAGQSRDDCDLPEKFRHKEKVLKPWLSAWEQGYDYALMSAFIL